MNKLLPLLISLFALSCSGVQQPETAEHEYVDLADTPPADTLFKIFRDGSEEVFGYVDQKGQMVITYGQFAFGFSDTILTHGIVAERSGGLIGIDQKGQRLYEVFLFDNGPDYLQDGLFRILRNGKTGYADARGMVVIEPQFACAEPFSGGRAKVALDCSVQKDGEHAVMESDHWFYIDKKGERIE